MVISKSFRWALCAAACCSAAVASGWTDRSEYDLVLKIREESSAQKRLALLDQWKKDYPSSEQRQVRNELFLRTYESLGDRPKIFGAAREMLAGQPDSFVGAYWCALLAPESAGASPEALTIAEQAATRLLAAAPAAVPVDAWEKQKAGVELMAHRTLGWVHWQRREYAAAEKEFALCLEQNPKDGRTSAWFGAVLAAQPEPAKQVAALWHLTRAAALRDDGSLPEGQRRSLSPVVDALYRSYHGSEEGLEGLRSSVLTSAMPPQGFTIESAAVIAARRAEEELEFRNPQLAAWLKIRKHLEAPDGEAYFSASVRGAVLAKLKGIVVRSSPAKRPTELGIALSDATAEEVTLKLASALTGDPEPGLQIEFEGTGDSYTPNPFHLTLLSNPDQIANWPPPRSRR